MQIEHGGALDRAMDRFGGPLSDWIDLSTGINPEVFPLPSIGLEIWNRLPDEKLLTSTINAARKYYGAAAEAGIVAAPGTQSLIQILPDLMATKGDVAIVGPTYQEHSASFHNAGWRISNCSSIDEIPPSSKVAVVVNPNNPDGRIVSRESLLELAGRLGSRGGVLIVDEAFADPHPEASIADHAGISGLIILKSFGKFFGLGGLRLGFALTAHDVADALKLRLGPWAVSGPALTVASHAFSDEILLAGFAKRLSARRELLGRVLAEAGLFQVGGTMLFSLVEFEQVQKLHEALCEHQVLTRKFDYAPQWLRFGLPLDENAAERLQQRLRTALSVISR
ncbi:threonine-phosphate decarboxylase CobD [Phyllobacterium bourgognense]|uniref:threonine-phosphate decarboxylase n=1 Tax=Phyllobacterium bourgognense TaxID=314236 RepID=A0A368Z4S1_9HYPH|nr:threonine-phosphate decarboxylase CobD [Phyllobacterium bourgognense]RCW86237.1 L-threonine O-3-phosphate decarboxylase [Phyllobacterium bourgognense]